MPAPPEKEATTGMPRGAVAEHGLELEHPAHLGRMPPEDHQRQEESPDMNGQGEHQDVDHVRHYGRAVSCSCELRNDEARENNLEQQLREPSIERRGEQAPSSADEADRRD